MNSESLTIPQPDDFHLHLRGPGDLLPFVLPFTAAVFGRALVMPNTEPKIDVADRAIDYERAILSSAAAAGYPGFQPLLTIYLTEFTTPHIIREARKAGVIAAKLYPQGVTTNSEGGVAAIQSLYPVFRAMEECGMVLCLHGQTPGSTFRGRDREVQFLNDLYRLTQEFPNLRIVLEHVSTYEGVHTVLSLPETVAATITVHHLLLTEHDIDDCTLQPHHFCLPRPNFPRDCEALRWAATRGSAKFFFGSDSAPHLVSAKQAAQGKGGVFSAPVALPLLAQIFEEMSALDKLADFTSKFGAEFYRLPRNERTITLVKRPWEVPFAYPGGDGELNPNPGSLLVPFWAGRKISWDLI